MPPAVFRASPVLWMVLFLSGVCSAQVPPDDYLVTLEQISMPNLGAVNAILRDNRGFIWIATTKGLCKYDGYRVRPFSIGPIPTGGRQQDVTCLMQTEDTTLILGTGQGLWDFDIRTGTTTPAYPGNPLSGSRITAITSAPGGGIWVGTNSMGVFRIEGGSVTSRYSTLNGLSEDWISALLPDGAGHLWIGTFSGGLNHLDIGTSRITGYREGTPAGGSLWSDRIITLCAGGGGELWIGTSDGLNILDPRTGRMRRAALRPGGLHAVWGIVPDPSVRGGNGSQPMWTGVAEVGLLRWSGEHSSFVDPAGDNGRTLSSIRVLYPDPVSSRSGNTLLWIGARHGVYRMRVSTNPFANRIRNRDGLRLNRGAVLSLLEDGGGTLWVGLWGGGLNGLRREGGAYRRVYNIQSRPGEPSGLPGDDVNGLAEDAGGRLWIGTKSGLAMLDPARTRAVVFRHREGDTTSLPGDDITQLRITRSGALWICTTQGLSRLLPGSPPRFRNFLDDPADAHQVGRNEVSDVFEDGGANVWASTYGRGLNRIAPDGSVRRYLCPEDTSGTLENFIYTLAGDESGILWLSTPGGLVSFDPRTGEYRRRPIPELYNAHIFGIEPRGRGDLWLSTGIGLVRYNPAGGAVVRFDRSDGILFEELFSGFSRSRSGGLMAGGIDGFLEFRPEEMPGPSLPPEIVITGIAVFDREFPLPAGAKDRILLSWDQNFLSFSFAALDYENPGQNRFAYRMDGLDDRWIDAGTRNYASFTHLDPGEYVFRVKGCNSRNVWNETGISVAIGIAPPYWRTWWFQLAAAIALAGAVYGAYRYRLRSILAMERLRLRIADDLHDDVGSNLSTIAIVSRSLQHAREATPAIRSKLSEIYDTAVQTSEGMRDIVWFIKPKDDTIGDLLLRMKEMAAAQFREVEYSFHSPKSNDATSMAIEFKRNVYLAFKEIVTNIVKHAGATRVDIGISMTDGLFEMTIADNGRGFDTGSHSQGSGLGSLQKRARVLGGMCDIRSGPGSGTTVAFTANMKASRRARSRRPPANA